MQNTDALVTTGLLLLGLTGLWLLFGKWIVEFFKTVSEAKGRKRKKKKKSNLDRMFELTAKNDTDASLAASRRTLLLVSIMLFIASAGCAIAFLGFDLVNIILCLFVACLPVLFRYGKMQKLRLDGGYDGQDMVSELRTQYKAHNNNFIYAIDATIERLKNHPYSQRQLAKLSLKLKTYGTEEELIEALETFNFAYNTEWIKILSFAIFHSVQHGSDASLLLDDLIETFKRINTAVEKSKRYSRDTLVVLRFLIPATFFGLMFFGGSAFNLSFLDMLERQVTDPLGFKLLMAVIVMYGGSLVYASLMSKPKYDL